MTAPVYLLQSEADVAPGDEWLTSAERERLAAFPVEKRRRDWRLGRWTAKRLLAALDGVSPTEDGLRRYTVWPTASGVPVAHKEGASLPRRISLSHSHGIALVLAGEPPAAHPTLAFVLGCDLERIEPRVRGFEEDYLTERERAHVAAAPLRDLATTLFWTGKESVMKALGEGLRLAAQSVEVEPTSDWPVAGGPLVPFAVRRPTNDLEGRWGILLGLAAALVTPLGSDEPIRLDVPAI